MLNAMFNIRARTAAYKVELVSAVLSMVIQFLPTAANAREPLYVSFTAETRVRFP